MISVLICLSACSSGDKLNPSSASQAVDQISTGSKDGMGWDGGGLGGCSQRAEETGGCKVILLLFC